MADEELNLEQFIQKVLNEEFPDADIRPGTPYYEFFVKALNAVLSDIWVKYRVVNSYLYLKNFNEMAEESMDSLASNFLVQRAVQDKYQGNVKIYYVTAPDKAYITPLTTVYNKSEAKFFAKDFYTFSKDEIESNFDSVKNMYFIIFPVIAEDVGEDYKTLADEIIRVEGITPTSYDLIGNDSFLVPSGSSVKETNEDLYAKIQRSLATRELVQNDAIFTVIKSLYPVDALYSYGCGSSEVTRDLVENVHVGTAVDIYCKTSVVNQGWFLRKKNLSNVMSEIIDISELPEKKSFRNNLIYRILTIDLSDTDNFDVFKNTSSLTGKRIYRVTDIQDTSGNSFPVGSRYFKTLDPSEVKGKYGQGNYNEGGNWIFLLKGNKNYFGSYLDKVEIWANKNSLDTLGVSKFKVILDIFDTQLDIQNNVINENPVLHSEYLSYRYLYGLVTIVVRKISGVLDIDTIKTKINEYLYSIAPGESVEAAEIFRIISEVSPKALVEVPFTRFSAKIEQKNGKWKVITDESILNPSSKLVQFVLSDFIVI